MNDIIDFFHAEAVLRSFNTFIGHLNIDYLLKQRSCYSDAVFPSVEGTALLLLGLP
jgi:hypothetical protein